MLSWCRVFTFGLLACHVAACSHLPPEERAATCASTDWTRYGENDGRLGVANTERADHFADCSGLGHAPDLAGYQAGRAIGLETYCTAQNGYRVGYEDGDYEGVCPPTVEPAFLRGFEQGQRERSFYAFWPRIRIGIDTGGVHTRIGVGQGVGIGFFSGYFSIGG